MRVAVVLMLCLVLSACATDMGPLYRSEAEVPADALLVAARGEGAEETAALVLLADLSLHYPEQGPTPETLATVMEALGTRAAAGTLPANHLHLAGTLAEGLALDDLQDAVVRMNACDLLGELENWDALVRVAEEAADPMVGEQAGSVLAAAGQGPRP